MIETINGGLVAILWGGACLILLPLLRALHDRSLRLLSTVLMVYALSRLFSPNTEDTSGISSLVLNLLILVAAYLEVWFFRTVVSTERNEPPPRMHVELLAAIAVGVVAVTAWLAAPPSLRSTLPKPRPYEPTSYIFVLSLIGYYCTVSARAAYWTVGLLRSRRRRESASGTPTERIAMAGFWAGVWIIGCAELLRCSADVVKIAQATAAFLDPQLLSGVTSDRIVVDFLLLVGHTSFYLGVLVPILIDAAVSLVFVLLSCRAYVALGPLARATRTAFPQVELRAGGVGRCYRRQLEIRDAAVLLDGFYDADVAEMARKRHGCDHDSAPVVAELIVDALRAHRENRPAARPHPVPRSDATSPRDDTAWLVEVARTFRLLREGPATGYRYRPAVTSTARTDAQPGTR